jgi:hypothetical protein
VIDQYTLTGIANGGTPAIDQNIFFNDITNFLLGIPFAEDSSHMEGLAKTSSDKICTIHGQATGNPMTGAIRGTIVNPLPATHCVFTAVCDWNLIMASSDQAFPNQCHAIQQVLNNELYKFGYYYFCILFLHNK